MRTPAVRLKAKFSMPNNEKFSGVKPSDFSREKILTPINSAKIAFVMNKPAKTINKMVCLFLLMLNICSLKHIN